MKDHRQNQPPPWREAGPAEESVPLFGTWRNAYVAVVIAFVVDVVVFYAFDRYFS